MSIQGQNVVRDWFRDNVHLSLKHRGIDINLELVPVENEIKKPGPVFIEIARKAYDLGAEFMYRVNDDTEFHGRWPKLYSHTLLSLSKPYGVVGPRSTTTQNRILTHDFVHRTHMDIFDKVYYPVELVDWWMDDWISSIYGISRTFMSKDVTVIHHVKYHGRRYDVNASNEDKLEPLVMNARQRILSWMKSPSNNLNPSDIMAFKLESQKYDKDKLRYVTGIDKYEKYYQIKSKPSISKQKATAKKSVSKRHTPSKSTTKKTTALRGNDKSYESKKISKSSDTSLLEAKTRHTPRSPRVIPKPSTGNYFTDKAVQIFDSYLSKRSQSTRHSPQLNDASPIMSHGEPPSPRRSSPRAVTSSHKQSVFPMNSSPQSKLTPSPLKSPSAHSSQSKSPNAIITKKVYKSSNAHKANHG